MRIWIRNQTASRQARSLSGALLNSERSVCFAIRLGRWLARLSWLLWGESFLKLVLSKYVTLCIVDDDILVGASVNAAILVFRDTAIRKPCRSTPPSPSGVAMSRRVPHFVRYTSSRSPIIVITYFSSLIVANEVRLTKLRILSKLKYTR